MAEKPIRIPPHRLPRGKSRNDGVAPIHQLRPGMSDSIHEDPAPVEQLQVSAATELFPELYTDLQTLFGTIEVTPAPDPDWLRETIASWNGPNRVGMFYNALRNVPIRTDSSNGVTLMNQVAFTSPLILNAHDDLVCQMTRFMQLPVNPRSEASCDLRATVTASLRNQVVTTSVVWEQVHAVMQIMEQYTYPNTVSDEMAAACRLISAYPEANVPPLLPDRLTHILTATAQELRTFNVIEYVSGIPSPHLTNGRQMLQVRNALYHHVRKWDGVAANTAVNTMKSVQDDLYLLLGHASLYAFPGTERERSRWIDTTVERYRSRAARSVDSLLLLTASV